MGARDFNGAREGSRREGRDHPDARTHVANSVDLAREVVRLKAALAAARRENVLYGHIAHALAQGCIDLFYVNLDTGAYVEYFTDDAQSSLTARRQAGDFFESCEREAKLFVHEEDRGEFVTAMNREFLLEALSSSKTFEMTYRRLRDGKTIFVNMRVTRMEDDGSHIVIAVTDVDQLVRKRLADKRMQEERLDRMWRQVTVDALTGVKNKRAYLEAAGRLDRQIAEKSVSPFAVVVLDVNDLKKVNDSCGHQAGDMLLKRVCKMICNVFKHSPVFRIGGDEFAVIAQGEDHVSLQARIAEVQEHNERSLQAGGAVVACGVADFAGEASVAEMFERADRNMYEDKARLKSR